VFVVVGMCYVAVGYAVGICVIAIFVWLCCCCVRVCAVLLCLYRTLHCLVNSLRICIAQRWYFCLRCCMRVNRVTGVIADVVVRVVDVIVGVDITVVVVRNGVVDMVLYC